MGDVDHGSEGDFVNCRGLVGPGVPVERLPSIDYFGEDYRTGLGQRIQRSNGPRRKGTHESTSWGPIGRNGGRRRRG